jgi:hypothetical protein
MLRVIVCVAVLASGCAPEPTTRTVTKTRHCTTTVAAMSKDEFCAVEPTCPKITTCGEAYYRYTTCKQVTRDGFPRNGIPCQDKCGPDAMAMAAKIRSEPPFSPPIRKTTVCSSV